MGRRALGEVAGTGAADCFTESYAVAGHLHLELRREAGLAPVLRANATADAVIPH